MSRTKKGQKPPGWDYWGKRPGLGMGAGGKPKSKRKEKRIGIKKERAALKRTAYRELNGTKKEEID